MRTAIRRRASEFHLEIAAIAWRLLRDSHAAFPVDDSRARYALPSLSAIRLRSRLNSTRPGIVNSLGLSFPLATNQLPGLPPTRARRRVEFPREKVKSQVKAPLCSALSNIWAHTSRGTVQVHRANELGPLDKRRRFPSLVSFARAIQRRTVFKNVRLKPALQSAVELYGEPRRVSESPLIRTMKPPVFSPSPKFSILIFSRAICNCRAC